MKVGFGIEPVGFAWLRAAQSPISDLSTSPSSARSELANEFLEAVWLATPEFVESLPSELTEKQLRTLRRYWLRMAGRPTPFGLFATGSLVVVAAEGHPQPQVRFELEPTMSRRSVLDWGVMHRLAALWRKSLGTKARFQTTGALWKSAKRLHYLRAEKTTDAATAFVATTSQSSRPLVEALRLAREPGGVSLEALGELLKKRFPGVEDAQIAGFLDELVAEGLLLPVLEPCVIGEDVLAELYAEAVESGAQFRDLLRFGRLCERLGRLDQPGDTFGAARCLRRALIRSKLVDEGSPVFNVSAYRGVREGALSQEVAAEIGRGLELLASLAPNSNPPALEAFREAAERRYGLTSIPLLELLDERLGLGREWRRFLKNESTAVTVSTDSLSLPFEAVSRSREEWILRDEDVAPFLERGAQRATSLRSLAAVVTLGEADNSESIVVLHGGYGPSAATLLGRFCVGHTELQERVRDLAEREQLSCDPSLWLAEISHLPAIRAGNVLHRPTLRKFQVPVLAPSAPRGAVCLALEDLWVRSDGTKLRLYSRQTRREVEPSSLNAHNFRFQGNLSIYQFLSLLPLQGTPQPLRWSWGRAFERAVFLPRVRWGRLILSRARWHLDRSRVRAEALEAWIDQNAVPRFIGLITGEDEIALDLRSNAGMEMLHEESRRRERVALAEILPLPNELAVRDERGRYCHELIVPFLSSGSPPKASSQKLPPIARRPSRRRHSDRWLYLRLYAPDQELDEILLQCIYPTIAKLKRDSQLEKWYFLRYSDPDHHVRLRILPAAKISPEDLLGIVGHEIGPFLKCRALHRLEWAAHEVEDHRYGPPSTLAIVEEVFTSDSEWVLELIQCLRRDRLEKNRADWMVYNLDRWFEILSWPIGLRSELLSSLRAASAEAHPAAFPERSTRAALFRTRREGLETLLSDASGSVPAVVLRANQQRAWRLRPLLSSLRQTRTFRGREAFVKLVGSLLHLSTNRLQAWPDRGGEAVALDFLERIYLSRAARARLVPGWSPREQRR
ncbi:MAG: lantibiotic dehydratase [Thermoanaerobaculia bacterium]|nr:lantibiotic dehydratase [Thermoanaerobaculia bacterium]